MAQIRQMKQMPKIARFYAIRKPLNPCIFFEIKNFSSKQIHKNIKISKNFHKNLQKNKALAILGVGGNLGDSEKILDKFFLKLNNNFAIIGRSFLYKNAAWGCEVSEFLSAFEKYKNDFLVCKNPIESRLLGALARSLQKDFKNKDSIKKDSIKAQIPDFLNAILWVQIPHKCGVCEFASQLFYLERIFSRARKRMLKNAPRTLDIDIIGFGNGRFRLSSLKIPHESWSERESVLVPLFTGL